MTSRQTNFMWIPTTNAAKKISEELNKCDERPLKILVLGDEDCIDKGNGM